MEQADGAAAGPARYGGLLARTVPRDRVRRPTDRLAVSALCDLHSVLDRIGGSAVVGGAGLLFLAGLICWSGDGAAGARAAWSGCFARRSCRHRAGDRLPRRWPTGCWRSRPSSSARGHAASSPLERVSGSLLLMVGRHRRRRVGAGDGDRRVQPDPAGHHFDSSAQVLDLSAQRRLADFVRTVSAAVGAEPPEHDRRVPGALAVRDRDERDMPRPPGLGAHALPVAAARPASCRSTNFAGSWRTTWRTTRANRWRSPTRGLAPGRRDAGDARRGAAVARNPRHRVGGAAGAAVGVRGRGRRRDRPRRRA